MKKLILLSVLFFISCSKFSETKYFDASENHQFKIVSSHNNPSVLKLILTGKIDDTCKVMGVKVSKKEMNKEIFIDLYNTNIIIKYEAFKVKRGKVKIKYIY